jgi:hypothetical protein
MTTTAAYAILDEFISTLRDFDATHDQALALFTTALVNTLQAYDDTKQRADKLARTLYAIQDQVTIQESES